MRWVSQSWTGRAARAACARAALSLAIGGALALAGATLCIPRAAADAATPDRASGAPRRASVVPGSGGAADSASVAPGSGGGADSASVAPGSGGGADSAWVVPGSGGAVYSASVGPGSGGGADSASVASGSGGAADSASVVPLGARCPAEMVRVRSFCIDRWEVRTVDAATGQPLSPFYPPNPKLAASAYDAWLVERNTLGNAAARAFPLPKLSRFQREQPFEPRAVAEARVVPQGYLSYYVARQACDNAHKRLCRNDEWRRACRGEHDTQFPYGDGFRPGRCNVHRATHPGYALHATSSIGLLDPRLNLVTEGADPLLHLTGETPSCASVWGGEKIFDMVGNLDEWVEEGMFLGGFYARSTTKGCDASVSAHAATYFDYSTGARCCLDL